jgi:hypothetical protein
MVDMEMIEEYSLFTNKDNKWQVRWGISNYPAMNVVFESFDDGEKVALAMNRAYQRGAEEMEQKIKGKVNNFLFGD